jgi:malate dehydrogenase (oxaloacetate-decarboxylating)
MQSGAILAADGQSVNNVLGFPGILRGAVDANAMHISHEMYIAAAECIADRTPEDELLPNPLNKSLHQAVALPVAKKSCLTRDCQRRIHTRH